MYCQYFWFEHRLFSRDLSAAAMLHRELVVFRASCAGGSRDGIRKANSALKSMRYVSSDQSDTGSCDNLGIDLTALAHVPIIPWEYTHARMHARTHARIRTHTRTHT